MRRIIWFAIATVILIGIESSCSEDFIDLSPVSQANTNDFYKNVTDINNAVIASYKYHKLIFTNFLCTMTILNEWRSDNTGELGITDNVDNFTKDTGREWYMYGWDFSYKAIYMYNIAIEKAAGPAMSDELRNRYIAELRFLRAITYFELVQDWGGVPLILETSKSLAPDVINVKRNTVEEVYTQIIADLQFAEANLPIAYTDDKDIGRATKGATVGFLGKAYLTMGNPSAAETEFRKVMTYGYELLPDYADVFAPTNHNSKESLFELQFKSGLDPCPWVHMFASSVLDKNPGYGYNTPTQDLYDAFEAGDPRRDFTIAKDKNDLYYDIKFSDPNASPNTDANNNVPLMRYSEVLLLLAESLGETAESYSLINQVRNRVGLPDIDASTPGTFKEKLLHERRVEFACEDQRWHDLQRFGVAIDVMNAFFAKWKHGLTTIGHDDLLLPIPNFSLLNNPNLEQNPGYPSAN